MKNQIQLTPGGKLPLDKFDQYAEWIAQLNLVTLNIRSPRINNPTSINLLLEISPHEPTNYSR